MLIRNYYAWIFYIIGTLIALTPSGAHAACFDPPGEEAEMMYNADWHAMQFCNGTNWVAMNGQALPVCSDGQGVAFSSVTGWGCGSIGAGGDDLGNHVATQNLDLDTFSLVNGGSASFAGAVKIGSSVPCGAGDEGSMRYVGGSAPWEYCNGSAWLPFRQPRCLNDASGECYLASPRSTDDPQFTASNIRTGINILNVTGSLANCANDATGECILPATRSTGDGQFIASNIADGVNILGVTGTLSALPTFDGPADCPSIGDQCADTTIYAGYHPVLHEHLFIPPTDQSRPGSPGTYTMNWKNATGTEDIDPNSASDGQLNHANRGGPIGNFQAFQSCEDLTFGGHSDWYLPSRVELYYLWSVREVIEAAGNITNFAGGTYYWSSTEAGAYSAWVQGLFDPGGEVAFTKTEVSFIRVRCVRR